MQWFKHMTRARHDPFIWDLRRRFGGEGYFVYFGTVEIYADSFKPFDGWFLDVSIEYLKHELGIYHNKRLFKIFDFVRSWPDIEDAPGGTWSEDAPKIDPNLPGIFPGSSGDVRNIVPKWVANLSKNRVAIRIPNFLKIMDDYSRKKLREQDEMSGHSPDNVRDRTRRKQEDKKKSPEAVEAIIANDINRRLERLRSLPPKNGRSFRGGVFVNTLLQKDHVQPSAIIEGADAILDYFNGGTWDDVEDPFAIGRSVARSRNQFADPMIDPIVFQRKYGKMFHDE